MALQKAVIGKFKVLDVKEVESRLKNEKKNNGEKLSPEDIKKALANSPQFFVKGKPVYAGDLLELGVNSLDAKELMGTEKVEAADEVARKAFKISRR